MRSFVGMIALGLAFASPAFANDDGLVQDDTEEDEDVDDALDDILNDDDDVESVKDEQDALRSGDIDDRVGVADETIIDAEVQGQDRVIKTIQKKDFLKLGRFEAMPNVGFVTNDPFLNRYIAGVRMGYHLTEIFAFEGELAYAPDLGDADWKGLTHQLVNQNHVSPDISKLTLIANGAFQFSPIYGKVALSGDNIIHFDIYGAFGMGVTQTRDDLEALQAEGDAEAITTEVQLHPTTNFGGGARVVFNHTVAVRIDGRSLVYIETVNSTTLEMKNNFILSGGVSFFFPQMS
jgi:outer membrane beta-barrel protein